MLGVSAMLAAMQSQTESNASRELSQRCSLSVKQPFAKLEHSITLNLFDHTKTL